MSLSSFADRVVLAIARDRSLDRAAMKILLKASDLLSKALGHRLTKLRESGDPLQKAFSESQTSLVFASCYQEAAEILASRWDKLPDKNRHQYTPEQRYRILRLKRLLVPNTHETATLFRLSQDTLPGGRGKRTLSTKSRTPLSSAPLLPCAGSPTSSESSSTPCASQASAATRQPPRLWQGPDGESRRQPSPGS